MADLTLDLHTSLSQGSTLLSFRSQWSLSVLAWPTLSFCLYVAGCLDCTTRAFNMSEPVDCKLLNLQILQIVFLKLGVTIACSIEKKLLFNLRNVFDMKSIYLINSLKTSYYEHNWYIFKETKYAVFKPIFFLHSSFMYILSLSIQHFHLVL